MQLRNKTHTFEVVEKIPPGYMVWNIGENMGFDEYIPICERSKPNDPDDYSIKVTTLKAIRLKPSDVQTLREAAAWSVPTLAAAEKALQSTRHGYLIDNQRAAAAAAIDIYREITA